MVKLSQKETMMLNDQKSHEELCIKKYSACASQAKDPALKQLFSSLAEEEEQHLNTINQILSGQVPSLSSSSSSQSGMSSSISASSSNLSSPSMNGQFSSQSDADMCSDLLATEKFVSSAYDTTIFECSNSSIRNALNHIQKEEQEHGKAIFDYMSRNGMYNVQY